MIVSLTEIIKSEITSEEIDDYGFRYFKFEYLKTSN